MDKSWWLKLGSAVGQKPICGKGFLAVESCFVRSFRVVCVVIALVLLLFRCYCVNNFFNIERESECVD